REGRLRAGNPRRRARHRRRQYVRGEPRGERRLQEHAVHGGAFRRPADAGRTAAAAGVVAVDLSAGSRPRVVRAVERRTPMTPLWKRILTEKRAVIIPLAIGVLANIAAYALWVYPLGVKSAGAADRAAAATRAVQAAEQDLAAARALV